MLGAAMEKSPPETVKPQLLVDYTKEQEIREPIKTTYSGTASVTTKFKDLDVGAGETVSKKTKKITKVDDGKKSVNDKMPKKLAQRAKGTTSMSKPSIKAIADLETKPKQILSEKASLDNEKLPKENDSAVKLKSRSENQKPVEAVEKKFKSKLKKPRIKIPKKEPGTHTIVSDPRPENEPREGQIKRTELMEVSKAQTLSPARSHLQTPFKRQHQTRAQVQAQPQPQPQPEVPAHTLAPVPASDQIPPQAPNLEGSVQLDEERSPTSTTTTTTAATYNQALPCSLLERLQLGVKSYFSSRNSIIYNDKNKREGGNRTRARVETEVKEDAQKTDPGFEFKNYFYISESDSPPDQLRLNSNLGGKSSNLLTDKPQISQNLKRKKLKNNVNIQIPRKGYFYRSSLPKTPQQQHPSSPLELLEFQHISKNKSKIQISRLAPTGAQIPCVSVKKRLVKKLKPSNEADTESFYSDDESAGSFCSGSSIRSTRRKRLVERDVFFDVPEYARKRRSGKISSLSPDMFSEIGENDEKYANVERWTKKKRYLTPVGGDNSFDDLEVGRKSPSTLITLTKCINSVLGSDDELISNLEITPVNPDRDKNLLKSYSEETTKPLITPVSISCVSSSTSLGGKLNPTAFLMGEIDLHLELQNYLKAFNNFNVSKTRTKNTLHSKNLVKTQDNEFLRAEELLDGDENKKGLLSSTPDPGNAESYFSDELEEERIESRLPRSETQIPDVFKQILKKSTDKLLKQDYSANNSIDGYEKIVPFGSQLSVTFNSSYEPHEKLFPDSLSTNNPSQPQSNDVGSKKPSVTLELQDKIEIFYNILQEYGRVGWRPRKSIVNLSSFIYHLLNDKLSKKQKKLDLINFAKEISDLQGWKNSKEKRKNISLRMYVNMFQKLIKSPLSFKQIICVNNIISMWESNSEEFAKYMKNEFEKTNADKKKKIMKERVTKLKEQPSAKSMSMMSLPKPKSEVKPSKHLQTTLESFLNQGEQDYSCLSNLKGKVLVDVKLSGNQIQVKDLSYLNSELPSKKKSNSEASSELIIESVEKSHVNDVFKDGLTHRCQIHGGSTQIKKRPNSREKVRKVKVKPISSEEQNFPLQFEYDEELLRTQHPISSISEYPEPQKASEKLFSGRLNKTCDEKPVYVEDFVKPSKYEEFLVSRKPMNSKSFSQGLPKKIRSMADIKSDLAKLHKTSSAWSRSFFCYSALHSSQNKYFKEGNKEKKLGGFSKMQRKKKKQQKNTGMAICKPCSDFPENDYTSDISKMVFLFSDKVSPEVPKNQSDSLTNFIVDEEPKVCVDNRKPVSQTSSYSVDHKSFSVDLIHSESFLKQFSHMSILERDTNLLFKNASDLKFCPVTTVECKKNSNAIPNIFLTPEQFEKADLPNDDVMVILKKLPETIQTPPKAEDIISENGVSSYKNFNLEVKRKKKSKPLEKKFGPPLFRERKSKTRCQTCQLLSKQASPPKPKSSNKPNLEASLKRNKTRTLNAKNENSKLFSRILTQNEKGVKNAEEKRQSTAGSKKEETKHTKDDKKEVKNSSKMSLNLEDIPLELLDALKRIFKQVENLKKKKKTSGIDKKKQSGKKSTDVKSTKPFILKIHCENQKSEKQTKEAHQNKTRNVSSAKSGRSLRDDECIFFDADERSLNDDGGPTIEEMKGNCKQTAIRGKSNIQSTDSLYKDSSEEKSEESLLNQISDSLVEGQISCSLLLLDSLLKKKSKSQSYNQIIELVKENTETLIVSLERSTWQVLMILEALTQVAEKNSDENLKERLEATKNIVNKILLLNINRLANFQKLNSVSQLADGVEEDNTTFGVIGQCLKNLRQLFPLEGTTKVMNEPNQLIVYQDQYEINKLPETELLKNKSNESVISEIHEMKNKVVKELRSLEKMFLIPECDRSPSFLEEMNLEDGQLRNEGTPSEDWLHRTYGCMRLMQCLLKVWDTRMSLNTYPTDFIR